jgi:S-formylglutathione hydrolase
MECCPKKRNEKGEKMNHIRVWLLVLLTLTWLTPVTAQDQAGTMDPQPKSGEVKYIDVPAPALKSSRVHIPTAQRAAVYLPPSYHDPLRRFPVVYFLAGFNSSIQYLTQLRVIQGFHLQEAMDRLIGGGRIKEMIVVIPNGVTPLGGSFWVNSPFNGNWEDYLCRDLVRHIDLNFRTIATRDARAVAGHSMGGFGALNIAMRHPDVFASVYALSPGLAAPGGLETHPSFANPELRRRIIAFLGALSDMEPCQASLALLSQASLWSAMYDSSPLFALAYGAAFASRNASSALPVYPFRLEGDGFILDRAIWEKFELGFGKWEDKVMRCLDNLKRLSTIVIDVGENDEYAWITAGCRHVSQLLKRSGIAHELRLFPGGHQDKLRERLENFMFPALSRILPSPSKPLAE